MVRSISPKSRRAKASLEHQAARSARLNYVSDYCPGIQRRRRGRAFEYLDRRGHVIRRAATLERIRSLVIPPAWRDVWICPSPRGHIQATGIDAGGRKQYLYHERWRQHRDAGKFQNVLAFARSLPVIRRQVQADLRRRGLSREKVLAGVVRLLETSLIRVGNDEYASSNGSFGLTTLRNRHVRVAGRKICFDFKAKSGVACKIDLHDPQLAGLVAKCQDLPGQELFQYIDENGEIRDVTSGDVNAYLREISGRNFTAKDFRTWAGTSLAAQALAELDDFDTPAAGQRNIREAIKQVALRLGNTAAVCRKCYVHPAILDAYLNRKLRLSSQRLQSVGRSLSVHEKALLGLLEQSKNAARRC